MVHRSTLVLVFLLISVFETNNLDVDVNVSNKRNGDRDDDFEAGSNGDFRVASDDDFGDRNRARPGEVIPAIWVG